MGESVRIAVRCHSLSEVQRRETPGQYRTCLHVLSDCRPWHHPDKMECKLFILCVLVAVVCAEMHKSERLMPTDTCMHYERILKANLTNDKYFPCMAKDQDGNDLCYLTRMRCDSFKDCPNSADERHCNTQHQEYCATGFKGKGAKSADGKRKEAQKFQCQQADWQDADDYICYGKMEKCDGVEQCPLGDDESGC